MNMIGIALAAATLGAPQADRAGPWQLVTIGGGTQCLAGYAHGTGGERREVLYMRDGEARALGFYVPGWRYAEGDQPQMSVYFVGSGQLWPNLTAVVQNSDQGAPILYIGFSPERGAEVDDLFSRAPRLQLIEDSQSIGVFETPEAPVAVAAVARCAEQR